MFKIVGNLIGKAAPMLSAGNEASPAGRHRGIVQKTAPEALQVETGTSIFQFPRAEKPASALASRNVALFREI
jgi:hypothetical protein